MVFFSANFMVKYVNGPYVEFAPTKVNWRKVDPGAYKALTECKLEALQSLADPNLDVDVILTRLHDILREATEEASSSTKQHAK